VQRLPCPPPPSFRPLRRQQITVGPQSAEPPRFARAPPSGPAGSRASPRARGSLLPRTSRSISRRVKQVQRQVGDALVDRHQAVSGEGLSEQSAKGVPHQPAPSLWVPEVEPAIVDVQHKPSAPAATGGRRAESPGVAAPRRRPCPGVLNRHAATVESLPGQAIQLGQVWPVASGRTRPRPRPWPGPPRAFPPTGRRRARRAPRRGETGRAGDPFPQPRSTRRPEARQCFSTKAMSAVGQRTSRPGPAS